jgi:signal transduction histidine kinase
MSSTTSASSPAGSTCPSSSASSRARAGQADLIDELAARTAALAAEQRLRAVRIRAAERERVAREVHDAVGHTLTIATLHTAAARRCGEDRDRAAGHLRVAGDSARSVRADLVRMLSGDHSAEAQGLPGRLDRLVEGVRAAGVSVELRADGIAGVSGEAAAAAYRVVQEALTNAVRHAGATSATVRVRLSGDRIEITVENKNESPARREASPHPSGLRGLARRVGALGGQFAAVPGDRRFVVTAVIPCQAISP